MDFSTSVRISVGRLSRIALSPLFSLLSNVLGRFLDPMSSHIMGFGQAFQGTATGEQRASTNCAAVNYFDID
jgi:hypothetical protein